MQYKVVPFVASISQSQNANEAASQLETLISNHSAQGWEYVSLESVETFVAGSSGCFGIGATPGITTSFSMAVFKK